MLCLVPLHQDCTGGTQMSGSGASPTPKLFPNVDGIEEQSFDKTRRGLGEEIQDSWIY